jgi:hypothetical protein
MSANMTTAPLPTEASTGGLMAIKNLAEQIPEAFQKHVKQAVEGINFAETFSENYAEINEIREVHRIATSDASLPVRITQIRGTEYVFASCPGLAGLVCGPSRPPDASARLLAAGRPKRVHLRGRSWL